MKKMKRLAALFLAVVMVMAMGMTAFAAPGDAATGTITIDNATKDEEYKAFKIFDAVPSVDGKHVAYTATDAMKNFWAGSQDNPFDFNKNLNGSWNVTQKENVEDATLIAALQALYAKNAEGEVVLNADFAKIVGEGLTGTPTTTADGTRTTVKFSDVPYGYYLITSSLGATVTVDSMTPNANVIDKNQSGPSWDGLGKAITAITDLNNNKKNITTELDKTSANYGDTIEFKISIDTTNYEGAKAITEYNISDILGDGMSYKTPSDIKVSVVSTDTTYGNNGTKELDPEKKEYSVKKPTDMQSGEDGFVINIPWADVTTNNEGEVTAVTTKYPSPAKLVVEYSAIVDADAVPAADITNTARFTYKLVGVDEEQKPEEETKITHTYTYALAINKVKEDATGLADAKFKITKGNDTILVQGIEEEPGVYIYAGIASSADITAENEADGENTGIIVKSPASGLIVVKGIDAGTYTITETEAPAGYNLMTETKNVETSLTGTYTKTITTYYEEDGEGNKTITDTVTDTSETVTTQYDVAATTIVNTIGVVLPSTGGIGTTIFYVVGGILVLGAGVLLITKKRMSARD